ncbi:hypothetical protein FOA52_002264 [Chlamydomonas sp. UWO 241]|nr:hypothetical protein FOA52_002264 [Chlamydomonas sp. UWO 241]
MQARATASVVREIELLKQLRGHAHIVQLERVHTSPCFGRIYLTMEHLPTTLAMLMAEDPGAGLLLEQARGICRQVLIALRYLHARVIGHHGLSPSNILFTPGYGSAKLSDFASAGLPGNLAAGFARRYRAPEQLVGAPVGCEADVWALGCILFEMAAGTPLLPGNSDDEQLTLVERIVGALPARFQLGRNAAAAAASAGSSSVASSMHERSGCAANMLYARGVHPDLADVVAACLKVDPLNRASARDLLLMPLFQKGGKAASHASSPLLVIGSLRRSPTRVCTLSRADESFGGSLTTGNIVCLTSSTPDISPHASPLADGSFGGSLTTGDVVCLTSCTPDISPHASPLARSLPEEANAVGLTSPMPGIAASAAALIHPPPPPEAAGVGSTSTRSAANFAQLGSCNDSCSAKQQVARVPPGMHGEEQQQVQQVQQQQVPQHGAAAPQPARERKGERIPVRHMSHALHSLRSSWRGAVLKVTSALGSGGDSGSAVDTGGGGGGGIQMKE